MIAAHRALHGGRRRARATTPTLLLAVLAALAALVAACSNDGERGGAPERSTVASTTGDTPAQKPTSAVSATTTPATVSSTTATFDDGEDAPEGDGPFGRGPGRGRIAAPPPPGPLVDGTTPSRRPAIAVKIDNLADAWPQAGINQADVTFEILVEGVSRFAAVFNSEDADLVGPVRSARTSDLDLLTMLNWPCFAFSGGNEPVLEAVGASALIDVSATAAAGAYHRVDDKVMPHNLMTSTTALRAACDDADVPAPIFSYRTVAAPDARGAEVAGVALQLGASRSRFVWDGRSGRWLRFVGDYAQLDTAGVQVSPVNVVVLETEYYPSPADSRSPEAQTVGEGAALVLVDGRVVTGSWTRSSATDPYELTGEDGAPIELRAGRTWVVLAPPGTTELLGPDGS